MSRRLLCCAEVETGLLIGGEGGMWLWDPRAGPAASARLRTPVPVSAAAGGEAPGSSVCALGFVDGSVGIADARALSKGFVSIWTARSAPHRGTVNSVALREKAAADDDAVSVVLSASSCGAVATSSALHSAPLRRHPDSAVAAGWLPSGRGCWSACLDGEVSLGGLPV